MIVIDASIPFIGTFAVVFAVSMLIRRRRRISIIPTGRPLVLLILSAFAASFVISAFYIVYVIHYVIPGNHRYGYGGF